MFIITEWSVDSGGEAHASVRLFNDYDGAKKAYGETWDSKTCPCGDTISTVRNYSPGHTMRVENNCECGQNYVSIRTTTPASDIVELTDFQDGDWKRPSGKQLRVVTDSTSIPIQVYPENRTYYYGKY
jgi:hypothetical protein